MDSNRVLTSLDSGSSGRRHMFCFRIAGLLVDTLMDPVLTSTMLAELKPATGCYRNLDGMGSFTKHGGFVSCISCRSLFLYWYLQTGKFPYPIVFGGWHLTNKCDLSRTGCSPPKKWKMLTDYFIRYQLQGVSILPEYPQFWDIAKKRMVLNYTSSFRGQIWICWMCDQEPPTICRRRRWTG